MPLEPDGSNTRHFWRPTQSPPQDQLQKEVDECASRLRDHFQKGDSLFSPRTAEQLRRFVLGPNILTCYAALYFAGTELWRSFVNTGDLDNLSFAQQLSWLAFLGYPHIADQLRYRRNAFYSWICIAIPQLIEICSLKDLIDEAKKVCAGCGYPLDVQRFYTAIVQAHAGLCRHYRKENNQQDTDSLLKRNYHELRQIHDTYKARTSSFPQDRTGDEQNSWEFLIALFPDETSQSDGPGHTESYLLAPSLEKFIRDGSPTAVFEFVKGSIDAIQAQLLTRLNVKCAPENMMVPEGTIFALRSEQKFQRHPTFEIATQALNEGQSNRARTLFQRLGDELEGARREICRNFQAYALACEGELAEARRLLKALADSRFPYPSAYWNYACCSPADHADLQLRVLCAGLDRTPHPLLLNGAITLALLRGDVEVLRQRLKFLTFSEALLLSFFYEYDSMSVEGRDAAILRLNAYRKRGEPLIPDPAASEVIALNLANNLMNELIERDQQDVFEFWLSCRPPRSQKSVNHWSITADFRQRVGKMADALEAFKTELRYRLERLDQRGNRRDSCIETRNRAEHWLGQSMTPPLREVGGDIYRMLKAFDREHPRFPVRVTPDTKRLRDYFERPVEQRTSEAGASPKKELIEREPVRRSAALASSSEIILGRLSGDLFQRFREIRQLPSVISQISEISDALRSSNLQTSAECLDVLIQEWKKSVDEGNQENIESHLARLQVTMGRLDAALKQELSQAQYAGVAQLLSTFRNVNAGISRSLGLLPQLSAEPVIGSTVEMDGTAPKTAFAVRVRSVRGSAVVRLSSAIATLDDEQTRFPLRDRLQDFDVRVGPMENAVLTFETPPGFAFDKPRQIRIDIVYEHGTDRISARPQTVCISPKTNDVRLDVSPFIYNRRIISSEIKGHFFGREKEQEAILDAISDIQRPKLRYVQGIRRSGKSSLLESVAYEIVRRDLPLVPVSWSLASSAAMADHVGKIVYDLFTTITADSAIQPIILHVPEEQSCCDNPTKAYRCFVQELSTKVSKRSLCCWMTFKFS